MYQPELQFPPGHCPVPGGPGPGPGPCLGPGPSPGAVLGDFFPDSDRTQPRSHVIKATPRSRPRSGRRSETEARYGWCPVPYQPQGRPNTGGNPQPMMMPPRGHVNQHMVRQRAVDVTSNSMMTWQDRPGPPPLPPPPTRPPPYPSAERPYEYSQPPPNMSGGESFHGHMPPGQQALPPPPPQQQYQNMPPMQQGAAPYDYHGAPECTWRQMPMCHSATRPPFVSPQYSTPPQQQQQQQTRQYYHNPARQGAMPNVQYVSQYQQNPEAPPGTWAPPPPPPSGHASNNNRPTRYATGGGQQQPQVMSLPPMTTPPPGHFYIMERPPSQPLVQMYDAPEKDNATNLPPAYYSAQRNSMQTPNQQPRLYGQQSGARYSQAVVQSGTPAKPRGQHPSKQYQDHQKAYNQLMHHDMGHMSQNHQAQSKQYAPFNTNSEQVVTNETSSNIQQYPYFYRYSETVKTSQPLSEHCDMNAGSQHMNNHSCGDHALPVVSHQTKSTIISSKSVSEVQMLVGVSGSNVANEYRLPGHVERPLETQGMSCGHAETATTKLAVRPSNKQQASSVMNHGNSGSCQAKKHSVRNEACGLVKDKIAKVSKRSGSRMADARGGQPSSRGSCKRRLSDSSEVSTLVDRDRVYPHTNGQCSEQQENDNKPVPKLDLGKLDLCNDESDFEDMPETHFKCRPPNGTTPIAATSNGGSAFLNAISKETKNRSAKLLESRSKDKAKYDPFNPSSATSFEYSIDAENLVAQLCYSSPEESPPSSAQLGCEATGQDMAEGHNCVGLLQENSLSNTYTSHERGRENEQHISSEGYSNDLALLDINNMMVGECNSHSDGTLNSGSMADNNGSRNVVALNDCVANNDALWKEGVVLISKGLALLKSCKSKDAELNKRFELMLYDLERISRRGIVPDIHNSFLRLEEMSSQQHQYSSRLSYVDQLYEYKSKMVSSEDTTDLFDTFPPVNTDLPNVRDYLGEQMNEEGQLLDSTYSLSTGSKSVMTTPVQSQEINWRQYEEEACQEDNTNIVCDQDGVASNIEGSKWVRTGCERFPYSEQSFNTAKQMTGQNSGRRDFTPNSPYDSYPMNKDGCMDGNMPWSGKPWDSYPNASTADEMYQQSMFYPQNHFDQLLQGQVGFGSGQHQNELGMLCRNENTDGESPSLFQVNSSNTIKDALSFTQRQLSNCEQDIHYLQSAASKVAPVRTNKKNGSTSCTSTTKVRRRATGQTGGAGDADGADLNAPACVLIDTESDDNASYYMKPGNYLVPKKPMSARLRTEKKVITRNKRKAFSAPAKTSIFIPYPLDPVVPPLPQLSQNPTLLFGTNDVSLPQEPSRLTVPSANLINDAENFASNSCHQTFSPIAKSTKENKKTNPPIILSNTRERKKKDNPRVQYPKAAPKEVRQFQILKRVSKVIGKVDSTTGNSENPSQISGLNSVNESKNGFSKNTASETAITNIVTDEKEGTPHEVDRIVSSLQSLTINESQVQQRNRKNAAMKSILNLKVKSKVSEKLNPNHDARIAEPVLCDLDREDTCTSEVPNVDVLSSSQSVTQDVIEQNLGRPSSCQVSTNESKKSSPTAFNDCKTNKGSDIYQQSQTSGSLKHADMKVEAFTKILVAEPTRNTPPQRANEIDRPEHYPTSGRNRGMEPSCAASLVNPPPPSSRVNHRSTSNVPSKGVYALKVHTSAPNISLDRGGGPNGPSKGRLTAADSLPRGGKDSPLSRQFSECREKLDRLNAQKGGPGSKAPNAGSDDSSSTISINSRHRRGPTPVALGKFEKILRSVWNLPEAQFVKHNVSSNELQEYYQIVKYPIFLENIETKLKNRYYMTIEDIVHDFRQILFNSRLYFKGSPPVLKKSDIIESRLNELLNEYFSGWDFRQITGDPAERLRNRR